MTDLNKIGDYLDAALDHSAHNVQLTVQDAGATFRVSDPYDGELVATMGINEARGMMREGIPAKDVWRRVESLLEQNSREFRGLERVRLIGNDYLELQWPDGQVERVQYTFKQHKHTGLGGRGSVSCERYFEPVPDNPRGVRYGLDKLPEGVQARRVDPPSFADLDGVQPQDVLGDIAPGLLDRIIATLREDPVRWITSEGLHYFEMSPPAYCEPGRRNSKGEVLAVLLRDDLPAWTLRYDGEQYVFRVDGGGVVARADTEEMATAKGYAAYKIEMRNH